MRTSFLEVPSLLRSLLPSILSSFCPYVLFPPPFPFLCILFSFLPSSFPYIFSFFESPDRSTLSYLLTARTCFMYFICSILPILIYADTCHTVRATVGVERTRRRAEVRSRISQHCFNFYLLLIELYQYHFLPIIPIPRVADYWNSRYRLRGWLWGGLWEADYSQYFEPTFLNYPQKLLFIRKNFLF